MKDQLEQKDFVLEYSFKVKGKVTLSADSREEAIAQLQSMDFIDLIEEGAEFKISCKSATEILEV